MIAAIILGALTQVVLRSAVITGIVGWSTFLIVVVIQILIFGG